MGSVKMITDSEFKNRMENSDKTVTVSFRANCSAASRMIEPLLEAAEYAGKAEIYKMDTDCNFDTPTAFQINGLPALLISKKANC